MVLILGGASYKEYREVKSRTIHIVAAVLALSICIKRCGV